MVALMSFTGVRGLSLASLGTRAIFATTSCPSTTWPKTVYSPFSEGYSLSVMKNWQAPVLRALRRARLLADRCSTCSGRSSSR